MAGNPSPRSADGPAQTSPDERPGTLKYQPAFDGMRCIGLLSVMAAHITEVQKDFAPFGSYMFVDMFFVLSGYLITTLMLRERNRDGRNSLRAFYVRRIARLYPLILVIVAVACAQRIFATDSILTPTWAGVAGIAFYFSNFVRLTQLVDPLAGWGPLWSLSIEEQFYLVWPAIMLALLRHRSRTRGPIVVLIVGIIAMWTWRIHCWQTSPYQTSHGFVDLLEAWNQFYYSSFQRPDGLLIGCLLALVLARPDSRAARWLVRVAHALRIPVLIGLCLIVWGTGQGKATWQIYWGLSTFNIAIALLIVELLHAPGSRIARALSVRPLVWLGRRSYCTYAIHYITLTYAFYYLGLTSIPGVLLACAATFAIAGISYRYYEAPIQKAGHRISTRIIRRSLEGQGA